MAPAAGLQSTALSLIYEAALDPGLWPIALDAVARSVGGSGSSIVSLRDDGEVHMRISTSPVDAAARESYNQRYGCLDEVMLRLSRATTGVPLGCYELIDRAELVGSEFYADWLRQIDLGDGIFLVFERSPRAMTSLQIGGPLGAEVFATPERKRMTEWFSPHVRRAIAIQNRIAAADMPLLEVARAEHLQRPVATVDWSGRLAHCAPAFLRAIEGAGLSVVCGRLRANTLAEQADVERAIDRAVRCGGDREGSSLAFRPGTAPGVVLHILPIAESLLAGAWPGARALVIAESLGQPQVSAGQLGEAYGLTPTEAALAARLAAHPASLRSTADALGIRVSTAKTHLQRIFEKTGTHRQAELVQLLLRMTCGPEVSRKPSGALAAGAAPTRSPTRPSLPQP